MAYVNDDRMKYLLYFLLALVVVYCISSKVENFYREEPALLTDVEEHIKDISISDEEQLKREADFIAERQKANQEFANVDALLPDTSSTYAPDLTTGNFLTAGVHYGIDTRSQTKVKNLDMFRPLPQVPRDANDQPWFNMSDFAPDTINKSLS